MESVKPFFTVLRSDDSRLARHDEMKAALDEAFRLTKKEKKRFFVLAVIECMEPVDQVQRVPVDLPSFPHLSEVSEFLRGFGPL